MNIFEIIEEEYHDYVFRNKTLHSCVSYLTEERHINAEVNNVTDVIVKTFMEDKPNLIRQIGIPELIYFNYIKNMDIGDDFFVINPTILVKVIISNESGNAGCSIVPNSNNPFVNGKLNNPIITIRLYNTKPVIDTILFKSLLAHEIMHGYRMLLISLSNKNRKPNKGNKPEYKDYSNFLASDDEFAKFIKEIYCLTDLDEINTNIAEVINFVINNKKINFTNYKDYLKDIRFYNKLIDLKNRLNYIAIALKKDKRVKNEIGKIVSDTIYKGKYNDKPYIAFNKMCRRLYLRYTYSIRRFYEALWSVLEQDNRERFIEPVIGKIKTEELLRELEALKELL